MLAVHDLGFGDWTLALNLLTELIEVSNEPTDARCGTAVAGMTTCWPRWRVDGSNPEEKS